MKKILVTLLSLLILVVPMIGLHAAGLGDAAGKLNQSAAGTGLVGGSAGSLEGIISNIIKIALSLVGTIFFVLTIYAGYMWMTAGGSEEKIDKAKNILRSSIIGIAIVLGAYAITAFVTARLAG